MVNNGKIVDANAQSAPTAEDIRRLEDELWEQKLETRRAQQRAEKRAAQRRMLYFVNAAGTLAALVISFFWILAASAGEVAPLSCVFPLTVGFSAAYRWGYYR